MPEGWGLLCVGACAVSVGFLLGLYVFGDGHGALLLALREPPLLVAAPHPQRDEQLENHIANHNLLGIWVRTHPQLQ